MQIIPQVICGGYCVYIDFGTELTLTVLVLNACLAGVPNGGETGIVRPHDRCRLHGLRRRREWHAQQQRICRNNETAPNARAREAERHRSLSIGWSCLEMCQRNIMAMILHLASSTSFFTDIFVPILVVLSSPLLVCSYTYIVTLSSSFFDRITNCPRFLDEYHCKTTRKRSMFSTDSMSNLRVTALYELTPFVSLSLTLYCMRSTYGYRDFDRTPWWRICCTAREKLHV